MRKSLGRKKFSGIKMAVTTMIGKNPRGNNIQLMSLTNFAHPQTPQQRHTAPTHHNTQGIPHKVVLGKAGSFAVHGQKTRHEQQIVPKSSSIGQGFSGQGWFAKVWAQNGSIRKKVKKRFGPKVAVKQKKTGKIFSPSS